MRTLKSHRTYTSPTYIAKIDLATFTNTDNLTVTGAQFVKAMAIDHNTTTPFLFVGTAQSPGVVVRIDLTTFTENATAVANLGENNFQTMEIDTDLGMIYLGTYTSPGYIVRFATSNMTRLDAVYYANVNSYLSSCSDSTYAYFASYTSPVSGCKVSCTPFEGFALCRQSRARTHGSTDTTSITYDTVLPLSQNYNRRTLPG